ncbi:MAG: hypothetical protein JEZ00_11905 [Anaerolineaceae bacterium]|nr:hypothetical protein [Anaerolineaceae bacterium]
MDLLEKLANNKGTVSSALGKELAKEVLDGKTDLLDEALALVCFRLEDKSKRNIRAGAAKIIEIVAEKQSNLISEHLEDLLPALEAAEAQTKWMIIRTMGFCARENPEIAKKALPFARRYIYEKTDGQLCLAGAADLYLGDYGEISAEATKEVFPILLDSTNNIINNEHDWIMEAFMKIGKHLTQEEKKMVLSFCEQFKDHPKKATQGRVRKLEKIYS